MTLQISESELVLRHGFKIVGEYKLFEKNWDNSWDVRTAKCLQKGNDCVIKLYHGKKSFTLTYGSKEDANKKIKQLINMGYKKQ